MHWFDIIINKLLDYMENRKIRKEKKAWEDIDSEIRAKEIEWMSR